MDKNIKNDINDTLLVFMSNYIGKDTGLDRLDKKYREFSKKTDKFYDKILDNIAMAEMVVENPTAITSNPSNSTPSITLFSLKA